MGESTHAPGEGPTHTRSVSIQVEQAVQRQIERDTLAELVAANEELHDPLTAEEIEAARAELREARRRAADERGDAEKPPRAAPAENTARLLAALLAADEGARAMARALSAVLPQVSSPPRSSGSSSRSSST
ncbi:hypothetical protein Q5762_30665 [Streptomyces sp. P9(2023)]|nr:hypothetical protein [Streptomyces sp. P9(2023)]